VRLAIFESPVWCSYYCFFRLHPGQVHPLSRTLLVVVCGCPRILVRSVVACLHRIGYGKFLKRVAEATEPECALARLAIIDTTRAGTSPPVLWRIQNCQSALWRAFGAESLRLRPDAFTHDGRHTRLCTLSGLAILTQSQLVPPFLEGATGSACALVDGLPGFSGFAMASFSGFAIGSMFVDFYFFWSSPMCLVLLVGPVVDDW
jgi:hypothetical protein